MSDLVKRLRSRDAYNDPDTWATLLDTAADRIEKLEAFVESIGMADGPYPELNGKQIVADSRRTLK